MQANARHCAIAIFVLSLAASAWPTAPVATPRLMDTPGVDWIGVDQNGVTVLQRGLDPALTQRLTECRSTAPVYVGDRLIVSADCTVTRAPLPARKRLSLGLRLNVNAASSIDLQAVSGIGPALARRIIAQRPYGRLADLETVRGIGPVRRARLTSSLTPAPPPLLWPSSTPRDASTPRKP